MEIMPKKCGVLGETVMGYKFIPFWDLLPINGDGHVDELCIVERWHRVPEFLSLIQCILGAPWYFVIGLQLHFFWK